VQLNPDGHEAERGSGARALITGAAHVADHPTPPAVAAGVPDLDVGGPPDVGSTVGDEGARRSVDVSGRRRSTLLPEPLLGGRHGPAIEGPEDLGSVCKELVAKLPSCTSARSVKLSLLHGSFSGAKVLLMTPTRADGRELPTSVIKYDKRKEVEDEVVMTNTHGPRWGPAHPRVLGVQKGEKRAVMQLELCGGQFGVPGYTRGGAVITFATFLMEFIAGEHPVARMQRAVRQAAAKLVKWSELQGTQMDLFHAYKTENNIKVRVVGPDVQDVGTFPSLLEGDVKPFFCEFLETLLRKDTSCRATVGTSHGDLHGGNLLLDAQDNVWLIDYATAQTGPGLNDFSKLLCAGLFMYTPAVAEDEAAFEDMLRRLAAVPSTSVEFPLAEFPLSERMSRLETFISTLWPFMCAANPDHHGEPVVWGLLRYAVRMTTYSGEVNTSQGKFPYGEVGQRRRCFYLATACAVRLQADVSERQCGWYEQASRRWCSRATGVRLSLVAGRERVVEAYLGQVAAVEGWFVDPVSREKVCVSEEGCIRVKTEFLPSVVAACRPIVEERRPSDASRAQLAKDAANTLSTQLLDVFPHGIPARLLITGSGGTGKTMLTKQIVVEACCGALADLQAEPRGEVSHFIPFRFPLQEIAPLLDNFTLVRVPHMPGGPPATLNSGWPVLHSFFEDIFGESSAHALALHEARRKQQCMLLLVDGLDEASMRKKKVLDWIKAFREPHVYIIMTTRPAAIEDLRADLGEVGFEALRITPLTRDASDELAAKIVGRSGVEPEARRMLMGEVHRLEYASLTSTPITLNLLVQVLARVEWDRAGMTIAQVYGHAVSLVLQVDKLKAYI